MSASRASLLALAASLEATAAELCAKAATIRATVDASGSTAPTSDTITLEAATVLLGSKRRARETFVGFEREGFEVRRVGHAVFMDRAEWDRAIAARSPKRSAPSSPTDSSDESPAAILARAGLVPSRAPNPQRRAPRRRAA
jgi:hypothetical protein